MVCSVCEVFQSELARLEELHDALAAALRAAPKSEGGRLVKAERIAKLHLVDAQHDFSRHRLREHGSKREKTQTA